MPCTQPIHNHHLSSTRHDSKCDLWWYQNVGSWICRRCRRNLVWEFAGTVGRDLHWISMKDPFCGSSYGVSYKFLITMQFCRYFTTVPCSIWGVDLDHKVSKFSKWRPLKTNGDERVALENRRPFSFSFVSAARAEGMKRGWSWL